MSWVGPTELIDDRLEEIGADTSAGRLFRIEGSIETVISVDLEDPMNAEVVVVSDDAVYFVKGKSRKLVDLLHDYQYPITSPARS